MDNLPEERLPDQLAIAEAVSRHQDWKLAIDSTIEIVRAAFLFDNMALYLNQRCADGNLAEVVYARAVGRGKAAEADAAWGAEIAAQVVSQQKIIIKTPDATTPRTERISFPYFLGLPLRAPSGVIGGLVFVRFGGPGYTPTQIQSARYIASQFSNLFQRKCLLEQIETLQDAKRQLNLQEDFIHMISHELRTPLGFIKGYSSTLLRSDTEWDETTRQEFLTIIEEEADHLATLIENILESARLQSATISIKFQPVRLEAVIRDITLRNQARYPGLQVSLNLPNCAPILTDNVRISQVIQNLFNNAVKYAPGAAIAISLEENENEQQIRFRDQGPGIPPEHLEHIFERFYRVPGQAGTGSGLGLFICKQIIQAHHGRMWAESTFGQGTTFIIALPFRHPPTQSGD
jgi:signal transduction histidine kinase